MGTGPWPGVSQVPACQPSAPLGSKRLSPWKPPSLKVHCVRSESLGPAWVSRQPRAPELWGDGVDWPSALTIAQEEDDILGGCLDGLQLLSHIEGLGCLLAGAWGTGNGTTSYSENVGALGITRVRLKTVVHGYVCVAGVGGGCAG